MSEPFSALHFLVEIRLPGRADPLCGAAFAECRGLEVGLDVQTLHEGGDAGAQRLLAGAASYGRVTLGRGMTPDFGLWDWSAAVLADRSLRADARVVVLAPDGASERARFRLRGCLPVRLRAPALDALTGGVAIEELELACEALALERPGAPPPRPVALAKAQLVAGDSRIAVQINPERVQLSHGSPRRLSAELWFESAKDVRALTQPIAALAGASSVRFQWGPVSFDGRVESLVETLDLFAPDGRPLRAQLALVLSGA